MEKTLAEEIRGFEITDELIVINKKYSKLGDIYDGYASLIKILENDYTFGFSKDSDPKAGGNLIQANAKDDFLIDREGQIKKLEKMQTEILDQMGKIYEDLRKELHLSRMLKGAMMLKAFNEVEREERQKQN